MYSIYPEDKSFEIKACGKIRLEFDEVRQALINATKI